MPTLRRATVSDAATITHHRHLMFADNAFCSEDRLLALDAVFEPWVREHLANGKYVGLLIEDDATHEVIAGAGIFFHEFAPHWMDLTPQRGYLLNFYTAPDARGQGHAKLLLNEAVAIVRARGLQLVTLHASKFGRPIYEGYGFKQSTEMMLRFPS